MLEFKKLIDYTVNSRFFILMYENVFSNSSFLVVFFKVIINNHVQMLKKQRFSTLA